jgi:hypothetical protein
MPVEVELSRNDRSMRLEQPTWDKLLRLARDQGWTSEAAKSAKGLSAADARSLGKTLRKIAVTCAELRAGTLPSEGRHSDYDETVAAAATHLAEWCEAGDFRIASA